LRGDLPDDVDTYGGARARLEEIHADALRGDDDRRFLVGGPSIALSPAATVALSMMLHELCTNAVKCGALSNDTGRVSISWTVDVRRDESDVRLQWLEYGGPPVTTPTRTGFGSRLLPALAQEMGGDAQISYLAEGVSCTIRLRLPRVAEGGQLPRFVDDRSICSSIWSASES